MDDLIKQSDNKVPEIDRTPLSVWRKMAFGETPYPKDKCLECGAIVKMGFFFDAFGRNKNEDESYPSLISNVSRLWQAHRDMFTPGRPLTHFWYRFYYSGLGAKLNKEAQDDQWIITAHKVAEAAGSSAWEQAKGAGREITGVPKLDPVGRARKSLKESLLEGSPRPMLKAWSDLRTEIRNLGPTALRILDGLDEETLKTRTGAYLRETWRTFKRRPYKAIWAPIKAAGLQGLVENVPIMRDTAFSAALLGAGFDTRLEAALRQFRKTYDYVRSQMPVRRIEVSIFAADRGCAIARQFANSLVRTYRRRNEQDLAIPGDRHPTEIRIRFMGLFDSVASIWDENMVLDAIPGLDLIKQNFGDRDLTVPAAVEQCVHFAAAHELRFYQRLDSLEKTRGEQYLYPGSSGDVTGVNAESSQGLHAELSRIPLRDMLHRGIIAGSSLMSMEELFDSARLTFDQFSISRPIAAGARTYLITDLVQAYRTVVPYTEGIDFLPHMKVFLRWLAVRYQDPAFRESMTAPLEQYAQEHNFPAAEKAYNEELRRQIALSPAERARQENRDKLAELKAELDRCRAAFDGSRGVAPPDFRPLWDRLDEEAGHLSDRLDTDEARAEAERQIAARNHPAAPDRPQTVNTRIVARGRTMRKRHRLSDEQADLIRTWQRARQGLDPLPEQVMTLFDALVHDAMLSSWQDHLLAFSPLYFRVRDKDTFGVTDLAAEAKQRQRDDATAERIERLPAMPGVSFTVPENRAS